MTKEQFGREKAYQLTLAIAKSMLQRGLIKKEEYEKINKSMLEKYRPIIGSLLPNFLDIYSARR